MENSSKNIKSIKIYLIKWLVIPLIITTVIIYVYIYLILQEKVNTFFDNRLFATARSLEQNIGIANSKLFVDLPNFSIDLLSSNEEGLVYYSVVDQKGDLLIGYEALFDKSVLKKVDKKFYNLICRS